MATEAVTSDAGTRSYVDGKATIDGVADLNASETTDVDKVLTGVLA